MNDGARKRSASSAPARRTPERLRSVLVPVDLTPSSDRVLGRLALLPIADDARLTLLHVVPDSLSLRDQRRAGRDAQKALAEHAQHLSRSLPRTVRVQPLVKTGAAATEIAPAAISAKAELIVMGRGGGRVLRDVFLGSTAERVVRRSRLPVLVVRLPPHAAYLRPALALALDEAAHEVVAIMLRVIQPPRPRVALVHAFDCPYQRPIYPSLPEGEAAQHRDERRLEATQSLTKLLATSLWRAKVSPEDAPRWKMHIRHGSPRLVIEKAVKKAETDLLVLGTHGYTGVAHLLLGTVAGDVLRDVACDVLVVPPSPQRG